MQLALQQMRKKFLLAMRGLAEKLGEHTRALGVRSFATDVRNAVEARIDIGQREPGIVGRDGCARIADRSPPYAASTLAGNAREVGDGDGDLVRGERAQEFRDMRDLGATAGIIANVLRGIDEGGE